MFQFLYLDVFTHPILLSTCCVPDPGHSNRNATMIKARPLCLREGKAIRVIVGRTMNSAIKERRLVWMVLEP